MSKYNYFPIFNDNKSERISLVVKHKLKVSICSELLVIMINPGSFGKAKDKNSEYLPDNTLLKIEKVLDIVKIYNATIINLYTHIEPNLGVFKKKVTNDIINNTDTCKKYFVPKDEKK